MAKTLDILCDFYREVWEKRNLDAIPTFFDPEPSENVLVPDRKVELDEIREWMEILFGFVTNLQVRLIKAVEDGEWVSAYLEVSCTCLKSGKPVQVMQQVMCRQANGRLVESYPQFDFLRFFEQVGMLPDDTYALLMGGHSLR